MVGNIILFVPLGLLCGLLGRRAPALLVVPATAVLAFAFSTGIETVQTCFQGRVAWRGDIVNNTIGAFAGVAAVFLVPRPLARRAARQTGRLVRTDPLIAALLAFLIIAALRAWFPFNVAISVSDLKNGLKSAVVVPFDTITLKSWLTPGRVAAPLRPFNGFDFAGDIWFWAFWGYLATAAVHARAAALRFSPAFVLFTLLVLPPCLTESGQLFINSRTLDINEFISGLFGVCIGWAGCLAYMRRRPDTPLKTEKGLVVPFLAYVLFNGLAPFDFQLPSPGGPPSLRVGQLVPFLAYFSHTSIWNLYDIAEALLYGAPLALIVSNKGNDNGSAVFRAWPAALAALFLGVLVEVGQLFLPSRTTDVTDPLIMAAGAWIAAHALRRLSTT